MSGFADQSYVSARFRLIGYAVIYAILVAGLALVLAKFGSRGPQIIPAYDGAILLGLAILGAPIIVLALRNYLGMRSEFKALERELQAAQWAIQQSDTLAAELTSEFHDVTEQDDDEPNEASRLTLRTPIVFGQWSGHGGSEIVTVARDTHGK